MSPEPSVVTTHPPHLQPPTFRQDLDHDVFNNLAVGLAVVALDRQWLKVNPAFCRRVGYSEAEISGMTLFGLTHPDDTVISPEQRDKAFVSGDILNFEKRYVHKDGSVIWVHVISALKRDGAGEPLYFISQIADVSGRKCSKFGAGIFLTTSYSPHCQSLSTQKIKTSPHSVR